MSQPNVLLVCVDHWPGRLFGGQGHPHILTPTLDTLMRNGVTFTRAYSATPTCIPARRELMTGTEARTHGDRVFADRLAMPALPTLAQTFRDAGYQADAVGKLHVFPQRDGIGFDNVVLHEEGRHQYGLLADDYELYLAAQGYPGQELTHAMCNNDYMVRPWHLPERCHPTHWAVREMCGAIHRRDPNKPGFWYLSFAAPHPPLTPLRDYLEMYQHMPVDAPFVGEWARDFDKLPYALKARRNYPGQYSAEALALARRAFYAQCTYIDHQLRLVIGLLREEGLLEDTIIMFTADHGDMLGNHGLYAKGIMYEDAAQIPMLLSAARDDRRVPGNTRDSRLAALADVMPTLLDLCGIPIPATVEGLSLAGEKKRALLHGEHYENDLATRMVHDGRHKLIWYAVGNRTQLFDLDQDPREMRDVASSSAYAAIRERLLAEMVKHFYGSDLQYLRDGKLAGLPDKAYFDAGNRGYGGQRGWRFM